VPSSWLLLIYTVPADPSRLRATVWREIKKSGAVYLRDGVCTLPETPETTAALRAIAARVEELGGHATLVTGARLDAARAEEVATQSRKARTAEYEEIGREVEGFLEHVRRETEHREFTFAELEELEEDLGKLKRWVGQVRARDHFGGDAASRVDELLRRCDEELGAFMEEASHYDAAP
jgi:hypothetical protein